MKINLLPTLLKKNLMILKIGKVHYYVKNLKMVKKTYNSIIWIIDWFLHHSVIRSFQSTILDNITERYQLYRRFYTKVQTIFLLHSTRIVKSTYVGDSTYFTDYLPEVVFKKSSSAFITYGYCSVISMQKYKLLQSYIVFRQLSRQNHDKIL